MEFGDGTRGWVSISAAPILDDLDRLVRGDDDARGRHRSAPPRARSPVSRRGDRPAGQSLDPDDLLQQLAELAVPRLADWCTFTARRRRHPARRHGPLRALGRGRGSSSAASRWTSTPSGCRGGHPLGQSQLTPVLTREMLAATAPDDEFVHVIADELELHSVLTVPLRARGETFGALTSGGAGRPRYTERDVAFAEDFATRAALAVDNARLYTPAVSDRRHAPAQPAAGEAPGDRGIAVATRYRAAGPHNRSAATSSTCGRSRRGPSGSRSATCAARAPAAALTALARHTIRTASIALPGHAAGAGARQLNDGILNRSARGNFCTAAHALFERRPTGPRSSIAAGGHPRPFLVRADGSIAHPGESGTLLGAFAEIETHEYPVRCKRRHARVSGRTASPSGAIRPSTSATSGSRRSSSHSPTSVDGSPSHPRGGARLLGGRAQDDIALVILRA